jgi:hypothetical protein
MRDTHRRVHGAFGDSFGELVGLQKTEIGIAFGKMIQLLLCFWSELEISKSSGE